MVDQKVTNAQIVTAIKEVGGPYLKAVHLFDLYKGNFLPANKKSLAYTLTYQADQGTLTEDQVNEAFDKVIAHLKDQVKQKFVKITNWAPVRWLADAWGPSRGQRAPLAR